MRPPASSRRGTDDDIRVAHFRPTLVVDGVANRRPVKRRPMMTYRVYSGPRGSQSISPLEKDRHLYKEFGVLDEAMGWARHINDSGRKSMRWSLRPSPCHRATSRLCRRTVGMSWVLRRSALPRCGSIGRACRTNMRTIRRRARYRISQRCPMWGRKADRRAMRRGLSTRSFRGS